MILQPDILCRQIRQLEYASLPPTALRLIPDICHRHQQHFQPGVKKITLKFRQFYPQFETFLPLTLYVNFMLPKGL